MRVKCDSLRSHAIQLGDYQSDCSNHRDQQEKEPAHEKVHGVHRPLKRDRGKHRQNICSRTNCHSTADLVQYAIRNGIIELSEGRKVRCAGGGNVRER